MFDLFLTPEEARQIKAQLQKKPLAMLSLRLQAEHAAKDKLYCVTENPSPAVSGNPHDYFSEGTYWWPDPENPDGPYIRKDGVHNPNVFLHHHQDLTAMNRNVYLLCAAAYYLEEPAFAARALEQLNTWFVNEETKMNPHMQYSQAIRGICDGRGIGIIDCRILIATVMGCWYLYQLGCGEQLQGIVDWFKQFLHWMNTAPRALEEKNYINNHANWFNTQNAAYAILCEDKARMEEFFERFRTIIIPNQVRADGAFADELKRTNSYTYCLMNIDATALICEMAAHNGQDLYHFADKDGKGFEKIMEFMLPYYENSFLWQYQQIAGSFGGKNISLQLYALRCHSERAKKVNGLRDGGTVMHCSSEFGICELMNGTDLDAYLD